MSLSWGPPDCGLGGRGRLSSLHRLWYVVVLSVGIENPEIAANLLRNCTYAVPIGKKSQKLENPGGEKRGGAFLSPGTIFIITTEAGGNPLSDFCFTATASFGKNGQTPSGGGAKSQVPSCHFPVGQRIAITAGWIAIRHALAFFSCLISSACGPLVAALCCSREIKVLSIPRRDAVVPRQGRWRETGRSRPPRDLPAEPCDCDFRTPSSIRARFPRPPFDAVVLLFP